MLAALVLNSSASKILFGFQDKPAAAPRGLLIDPALRFSQLLSGSSRTLDDSVLENVDLPSAEERESSSESQLNETEEGSKEFNINDEVPIEQPVEEAKPEEEEVSESQAAEEFISKRDESRKPLDDAELEVASEKMTTSPLLKEIEDDPSHPKEQLKEAEVQNEIEEQEAAEEKEAEEAAEAEAQQALEDEQALQNTETESAYVVDDPESQQVQEDSGDIVLETGDQSYQTAEEIAQTESGQDFEIPEQNEEVVEVPEQNEELEQEGQYIDPDQQEAQQFIDQMNEQADPEELKQIQSFAPEEGEDFIGNVQVSQQRAVIDPYGAVMVTDEKVPLGYVNTPTSSNAPITAYTGPIPPLPQPTAPPVQPQPVGPPRMRVPPMVYADIESLVKILNAINEMYAYYYKILPKPSSNKNQTQEQHIQEMIEFYSRVRTFVHTVIYNRSKLIRDLTYFDEKIGTLRSDEQQMLRFYGMEFKYYTIKTNAEPLMGTMGNKLNGYFSIIKQINSQFDIDAKNLLAGGFDLNRLNEFFQNEINGLSQNSYNNSVLSALDKFDKVSMFVIRLVEIRLDIERSIAEMKRSLINLKGYQIQLEDTMMTLDEIVESSRREVAAENGETYGSVSTCSTVLALLALFML